jgi:hypothetical protein
MQSIDLARVMEAEHPACSLLILIPIIVYRIRRNCTPVLVATIKIILLKGHA